MKLYTRCKSCGEEISFYSDVNDRAELEMRKGKEFFLTCKSCHAKHKYHVNDFQASKSVVQKLSSAGVALLLAAGIIFAEFFAFSMGVIFYGTVFLVPVIAFGIINKQQQTRLNAFNRYRVKQ